MTLDIDKTLGLYGYTIIYKEKLAALRQLNAEMLEALKGDVIELGNLAMMVDPELTKQYMESVYAAIAKAEGESNE